MRVTGKLTPSNSPGKTQGSSRVRFSEILKDTSKKDGMRNVEEQIALPNSPPLPFHDVLFVDSGQEVGAGPNPLMASLVQEVVVHAPPDAAASVHIQFDSRTLEGLHVRIQKTGEALEVRFSTDSAAVSHLLAENTSGLIQALTERGYVAPAVSVECTDVPASSLCRESRRDGDSRQERGGQGRSRR